MGEFVVNSEHQCEKAMHRVGIVLVPMQFICNLDTLRKYLLISHHPNLISVLKNSRGNRLGCENAFEKYHEVFGKLKGI